jgi:predicted transposase/invertase (TIGR01784 family)
MPKLLDPKLDVVFKILFASEQNRDLLVSLLTAVLRPSSPIASVEVLNPEMPKELVTDKGAVLDLRVRLADARLVDVEMQSSVHAGLRSRALYYWARMYCSQLGPGMSYEELQPCVAIFILGENELPSDRFHSTFRVTEIHGGEPFSDQFDLHFVELPKLPAPGESPLEEQQLEDWGLFLWGPSDEEMEELARRNPMMAKAKGALEMLSAQPDVQELARLRLLAQTTYLTDMRASLAKGRAEGRAEGEAKGKADALLQLLEARGIAVPEDARVRIMACQDIAQLETWLRRAATAAAVDEVLG